jgi:2-iminobutanoate/2-iminopropanoate deaminase
MVTGIQRLRLADQLAEPLSHYTDAVIFGDTLWVSGLLGTDSQGRIVGKGDVVSQTEQVFKNIQAVLEAAGVSFAEVVRVMVYLTDINDRVKINPVRQRYFKESKPVSTLVEISALADPDALVEIEVVAYIGKKS